ncbi:ATP-binding protein [Chitinibacter sp. FCG-7]|uniref:ATP-binding protein n=1 Tax=Chitinibacter mangrovi TaxID=3153927 RepID=A0AAU7F9J2_9NEIS
MNFPSEAVDTATANSVSNPSFQLKKLILIDSLSIGRIIEFPVDGGAVLTGRNGRGKTSMLQLLLLFYGESPNRIVTTEAGKHTFTGYYLPRTTSYIAFEYQRPDGGLRMVVAYADKHGEKVCFRLLREGFDPRQFVTADGAFVPAPQFVRHLKLAGFRCHEQQIESLAEYRAIMLATHSTSGDRKRLREIRELSSDYGFTLPNKPLHQIEKIITGMFRRKTNFEDLQSMVVECTSDTQQTLSMTADRKKLEDWPRHYAAYTSVMTLEPVMEQADQAAQRLEATRASLGEVKGKLASLLLHLEDQWHGFAEQKSKLDTEHQQARNRYTDARGQLQSKKIEAEKNAQYAEGKATELQQAWDRYEQQGIRSSDELVKRAPDLRDEKQQLEKRQETLLGEQSEIAQRYETLKQKQQARFYSEKEDLDQQADQERQRFETLEHQLEQKIAGERLDLDATQKTQREPYALSLAQAQEAVGSWRTQLNNPQVPPESQALVDAKQQALTDALEKKNQRSNVQQEKTTAFSTAKINFERQERKVEEKKKELAKFESALLEKQRFAMPEPGSLLHFLRSECPDWTQDIARVIDGELLTRTDLSPQFIERLDSLYGLNLDLSKLAPHALADESTAQFEITQQQRQVALSRTELEAEQATLGQCSSVCAQTETAMRQHEQVLLQAMAHVETAKAELASAKQQLNEQRNLAKANAEAGLAKAKLVLEHCQREIDQLDRAGRDARDELEQKALQEKKALTEQKRGAIDALNTKEKAARAELAQTLLQLDVECRSALQAKGIDTERLQEIADRLRLIDRDLGQIKLVIESVQSWRLWLRDEWPKRENWLQDARQHRAQEEAFNQKLKTLDREWKEGDVRYQTQFEQLKQQLEKLDQQQKLTRTRLEKMVAYTAIEVRTFDPSWTLDLLVGLANKAYDDEQQSKAEVRRLVNELRRGFAKTQGAKPSEFIELNHLALIDAPDEAWVPLFRSWFTEEHRTVQRILLMDARLIAGTVIQFHRTMDEFHKKVLQFNRELQNHLDQNISFESISQVKVEVVSTIRELAYWQSICEMAEANHHWVNGMSNELPPAPFAKTLDDLLSHWETKSGIQADLKQLIRIQGEVVENGNTRQFRKASDLEAVSSNGLSYLVLVSIFVAFINRIRRDANVNIVWALDELKDLDSGNVVHLIELLKCNHITLVSAFPDPDPETLALFNHCFTVEPDRRLMQVRVADPYLLEEEAAHV